LSLSPAGAERPLLCSTVPVFTSTASMLRRTSANTDRRSRTLEAAFCSPAATFAFQRAAAGLTLPAYFFGSPTPVFRPVRLRSPTPAFLEKIRGALQPEPVASPTCAVSSPATGPPLPSGESPLGIEALDPAPNRRAYRNAQPAFPSLPVGLCLIFSLRITVPGSLPYVRFLSSLLILSRGHPTSAPATAAISR
jgi:hypothetical protein